MKEIWRKISESDMYEVSNKGNFRSWYNSNGDKRDKPKKKAVTLNHKGYRTVSVIIGEKSTTRRIGRLVAEAFIPNPENKPQVNHIDGDKTNDVPSNLEWLTNQENRDHAMEEGLHAKGEDCDFAKLTKNDVIELRNAHKLGCFTYRELADAYGIGEAQAWRIVKRKRWKHV